MCVCTWEQYIHFCICNCIQLQIQKWDKVLEHRSQKIHWDERFCIAGQWSRHCTAAMWKGTAKGTQSQFALARLRNRRSYRGRWELSPTIYVYDSPLDSPLDSSIDLPLLLPLEIYKSLAGDSWGILQSERGWVRTGRGSLAAHLARTNPTRYAC